VDAFDDANAATDLAIFSSQFGLPAANFTKVFASGVKPPQDPTGGWELEASLDIEWAHAMAPSARIILVEAASNSLSNLLAAETVAANLVAAAGGRRSFE
jgi:subtilase family serine protease